MSLDNDYRVLRSGVGAVVLDRDVVAVSGPDAAEYLQGQLSQDVAGIEVGGSALSLLLEPQGRLDAFLRVSRTDQDRFLLDVDGGHGEAVASRLGRFKLRTKVVIAPITGWRCVALRGPAAAAAAQEGRAEVRARFDWPGAGGVDLMGPEAAAGAGVPECSLDAWEAVRIEAGLPMMGRELDERTIPHETGLVERAVDFTKGCYTGQELVARLDARGANTPRRLRGLVAAEAAPVGSEVVATERVVGSVTSAAVSPRLGAVALAYVRREVDPPADVILRWPHGETRARVEALPLSPLDR
ncbi:MAG TPA: glycine cleavage T C-terminal barrel domain-containing protein [Acidimicrobiales bacterium]|nr:glycine cleavage T C-terminal barrel domain-containing protein [Acidimicrobiales bacterium]